MALRDMVKIPDKILRRKAHKVMNFDRDFQLLVEDMIQTMRAEPGVGLAAPQVNVSLQLVVVEYPENDQVQDAKHRLYVIANPEITEKSNETEIGIEGCLSVPDLVGEVERATKIIVKGVNRFGKKQKIVAHGWLARIFQHEIDHVNGVLFVDRASRIWKPEPEATGGEIIAE